MHALLAGVVLASLVARDDPEAFRKALGAARPAREGIAVEKLHVDLGAATLTIDRGVLVPVEGPGPRAQEFLVLGDARFVLSTDDPVEAYQVELFTGSRRLDVAVTRAVLVIPSDAVADALAARPGRAPLTAEFLAEAEALLAAWRASPEYRHAAVDLALVEDAAGDPTAQRAFVAWCRSERFGSFLYTVDPFDPEPVRLQRFVPARLGDAEAESTRRELRKGEEGGRDVGRRVEDLGDWDIWFSSALRRADGTAEAGGETFEPESYDLRLSVSKNLRDVEGRARIVIAPRVAGARVVHFELFPDLSLSAVVDGAGHPVPWARSGSTVSVLLDAPPGAGARVVLDLRYAGALFAKLQPGLRDRRSGYFWYPRVGTVDRATYRVEIETPDSLQILASGVRTHETVEAGRRRQTRVLDLPTRYFGFEVGRYEVLRRKVGHVALEVGFLKDAPRAEQLDRAQVVDVVADALTVYEEAFGPYPLDVLTVAAVWSGVSRGYLSLLTIDQPIVEDVGLARANAIERAGDIAHELSHQWWANVVGARSYRDVWLCEALADYSAALYRKRFAARDAGRRGADPFVDRFPKTRLLESWTDAGRPLEAMGPVTLGRRLSSTLSREAFHAVVFDKGSMVFAMLADKLGGTALLGMLREIAVRSNHRDIDTETFLKALERMSGKDLGAFRRQFVLGVGYPELHVEQAAAAARRVEGVILQVPRGYRRDRLVRAGDGAFDVEPSFTVYQPAEEAEVEVVAVTAEGGAPSAVLAVRGDVTRFAFDGAGSGARLLLDPRQVVPAPVRDGTLDRKRALERRGAALRSAGREDEAVAAYREALATAFTATPESAFRPTKGNLAWGNEIVNGRAHLALAEIALDAGRVAEAVSALDAKDVRAAADADPAADARRRVLRARVALRANDPKTAYTLLGDVLALDFVQKRTDTVADALRREKFGRQREGRGGDYLLLAAAARLTGREEVAAEAAREAARRGADTSLLDEVPRGAVR